MTDGAGTYFTADTLRSSAVRLIALTGLAGITQSAFAILSARWLGPSERGVYTLGTVAASFSLLLGSFGVFTGARVLLADERRGVSWADYWVVLRVLAVVQIVVVGLLNLPVLRLIAGSAVLTPQAVGAYLAYGTTMTVASLAREGTHGIGRHVRATSSDVLAAVVQLAAGVALHAAGRATVPMLYLAGVAGYVLQMVVCRTSLTIRRRRSRRRQGLRTALAVVKFSAPGVFIAAGQLFVQKGDRLILGVFARTSDVGIYGVGATIADAAWVLPTAVSVIVLRQVARQNGLEPLHRWRPRVLGATAVAALGLAVATSALVGLLLGAKYHGVVPIVWVLAGGSILFASQQIDSVACTGLGRLATSARISTVGAVALVVLSLALIPGLHGMGAAIASVGAYGCMAIAARRAVRRLGANISGRPPPLPEPSC